MKVLNLNRFFSDENNTLGCLEVQGLNYPLFTCELPWLLNVKDKSCIPDGMYFIYPYLSPKFGKCLKIENVIGRENILIHAGNTFKDTHGCILVGLSCGKIAEEEAVLQSKQAMQLLLDMITEKSKLYIQSNYCEV